MPLPRRRRVAIGLFTALVLDVGLAAVTSLPAGAARSMTAAGSAVAQSARNAVATLAILNQGVLVRRKDKDDFKPATDGQRLRVGDTVQTDEAGYAQVNYTDDSFTRLDVNTTFTIISLADDAGNRQIKGSVESGQTWNRTTALTETESFEQEGAGATAAVTGTAFLVSCTSPQSCTFTSVVDGITLTTIDGEIQELAPLEQCDSDQAVTDEDANLCAEPSQVTLDAILANAWILQNLFLDGAAGFEGIILVEDGAVVAVTPTTTSTPPPNTDEVAAGPPPIVDADNPVLVEGCGHAYPEGTCSELVANEVVPAPDYEAPGLFSLYGEDVYFTINGSAGESGLPFVVVFTATPDSEFGSIWDDAAGVEVAIGAQYVPETLFRFQSAVSGSEGVEVDTNTAVKVVNTNGDESAAVEIPIAVDCSYCC